MKKVFFAIIGLLAGMTVGATNVTYKADESTIFTNPERGFITMLEGHLSESNPYCIKGQEGALDNHANKDFGTLILAHYYLENFRNTGTIPQKVLNAFDEDMQVLRNKGMKAIIRFSYINGTYEKSNGEESAKDAPLSIVKQHLAQYKSHWQANADVIFCFQAGLIGAWGEWYYTDNFGNMQGTINASRRELLDELLATVPQDRCIQLRTPLFKTGYIGSTKPLTASEAYQNTAKARLGHHNDAFLYHADNMGTYEDTATQKPYIAQETLYVPIGGESDITKSSQAKTEASHDATVAEMSRLHWTFIQSGYSQTVTNMWRENGTFDELNRNMGYRFQLVSATLPDKAKAGDKVSVNIKIKNVGYAPLYNERPVNIVLKSANAVYTIRLQSDPRTWLPNGVVSTIDEQITIPSNIANGTYQMYLRMPDAYASIASRAAYAVRFANENVWEASSGMNKLNASIVVSGGSDTPEPPTPDDGIELPATLNKANVSDYSEDMTWYKGDYFDFGPEDGTNTERWAEWKVYLRVPGKYIVTEKGFYPNGHNYSLQLLNGTSVVSSFVTAATWAAEEQTITQEELWDLSKVAAGNYTLRVQNAMEWGQPKLQSLRLDYDGELPPHEDVEVVESEKSKTAGTKVLRNGVLLIKVGDRFYTAQGKEVK